ncbi:MAG: uroporphyrinogen-III C-methyltransferase [Candidatus Kinetoplastibacterium crithidii]|nr:MAG: uroporphyrinogen-III C-methyltransferase [Candidatus Kinetoplastibacterium crithidii]
MSLLSLFFVLLTMKLVHLSNMERDLVARLELMESKNISLNRKLITSVNNSFDALEQKYNSIHEFIAASSKKDLSLDSIEILVNMANQYLLTTGNCNRAIVLLEKARSYLDLIDENEQVHVLKTSINNDISKLRKVPSPDISSYLISLNKLYDLSELLNHSNNTNDSNTIDSNDSINSLNKDNISFPYLNNFISYVKNTSLSIYQTLSSCIRINRIKNNSFLKDDSIHIMLQQQILMAKFALVTHQYELLSFNIKVIKDIASNYYDPNSKFISDVIEVVSCFNDLVLFNDFLDISDTLNSMKYLRISHSQE